MLLKRPDRFAFLFRACDRNIVPILLDQEHQEGRRRLRRKLNIEVHGLTATATAHEVRIKFAAYAMVHYGEGLALNLALQHQLRFERRADDDDCWRALPQAPARQ